MTFLNSLRDRVKQRYNEIKFGGKPPFTYTPEEIGPAIDAVIDVVGNVLMDLTHAINRIPSNVDEAEFWRAKFRAAELERLELERQLAVAKRWQVGVDVAPQPVTDGKTSVEIRRTERPQTITGGITVEKELSPEEPNAFPRLKGTTP